MGKQGSILIVDDEIGPRESLRMILKPLYDVHLASNGGEALAIIKKEMIDLVTVDLQMPGINGTDVLREIKKLKNDVEVIIITAYGTLAHAIEAIRYGAVDFISKPFNAAEIITVVNKSIERRYFNLKIKNLIQKIMNLSFPVQAFKEEPLSSLVASLTLKNGTSEFHKELSDSLKYWDSFQMQKVSVNYLDFLKVLVYILESKEPYTNGHSERVSIYSEMIAQEMQLSAEEKENLQLSALLHDIGKIGISNKTLEHTHLTRNETLDIKQHPVKGVHLIEPLVFPPGVTLAIRHHHERWDGGGYPDGLAGTEIPLLARIISLADSYDAMISDRPYRSGLATKNVWTEIKKNSGFQFDPNIVLLFMAGFKNQMNLPPVHPVHPMSQSPGSLFPERA
ncbi:MAG: response regulator [Deltaproteobacteria bacterium]|nr:response regulator [Deltaproteobacteria bacterium]